MKTTTVVLATTLAAAVCLCSQAFFLPAPSPSSTLLPSSTHHLPTPTPASTSVTHQSTNQQQRFNRINRLYMGRRAAKIAARKGKSDAIKTKIFALYGKKLVMVVKAGGGDPEVNRALAVMIKEAKNQGVPNENIQRAIQRGSNADVGDYKEAVYEAYGYGGAGLIINCLTDNTNRAKTEISNVIKKTEVKLASSGSVAFNFERRGRLDVDGVVDEDTILEAALEADVEDVESKVNEEEKTTSVFVEPASVSNLRDVLAGKGMEIKATLLVYLPKLTVECSDEDFEENMNIIAALEELDDVDSVEHNVDLTDEE